MYGNQCSTKLKCTHFLLVVTDVVLHFNTEVLKWRFGEGYQSTGTFYVSVAVWDFDHKCPWTALQDKSTVVTVQFPQRISKPFE